MRDSRTDLATGADAGRGLGEIMSGPAAVRNDPTGPGPAGWQREPERHALSLSLSLSLSLCTYRRVELCLVEM